VGTGKKIRFLQIFSWNFPIGYCFFL